MKKIFKKIGVFGLICAVLSPFVSLPKVNADDNCTSYRNQLLFMDEALGGQMNQYFSTGYTSYTMFLYAFPELNENKNLEITKVEQVNLGSSKNLEVFHGQFINLVKDADKRIEDWGTGDEQNLYDDDFKTVTSVLHGYWGKEKTPYSSNDWNITDPNLHLANVNEFKNYTIQQVYINNGKTTGLDSEIMGATVDYDTKIFSSASSLTYQLKSFVQQIVNDVSVEESERYKTDSFENRYVANLKNGLYMNFGINRKLNKDDLNDMMIGHTDTTDPSKAYIFSIENVSGTTASATDVVDSYDAYQNFLNDPEDPSGLDLNGDGNYCKTSTKACYKIPLTPDDIDFNTSYLYYWPTVLNIEYKVCNKAVSGDDGKTPTTGKWYLKYEEGVKDPTEVTNMPDDQEAPAKTSIKVSDKKPSREGYAFTGWKVCDGTTPYKAGDEVKNSEPDVTVKLCAQWGPEGPEENKGTGVISYVIGFVAVGLIAGSIYLVSKKKNAFKQI